MDIEEAKHILRVFAATNCGDSISQAIEVVLRELADKGEVKK